MPDVQPPVLLRCFPSAGCGHPLIGLLFFKVVHSPSKDIFPQSDGRSTWNHLVDTILKNGEWNAAYRATLRRVMDDYLSKGWLQHQVDLIYGQIARDARADNAIWHAGDIDVGKAARALMPPLPHP